MEDLKEALQEMFKTAGVKGTPLLFLMTDGQIVNERFLIYINDILANGWISDLFPKVSYRSTAIARTAVAAPSVCHLITVRRGLQLSFIVFPIFFYWTRYPGTRY